MLSTAWTQWLKRLGNRGPSVRLRHPWGSRPPALQRQAFQPRLEALEHRICLAWTKPINLGPPINTEYYDGYTVALTNNDLSLYFSSDRPGSLGTTDIWVSQRASTRDPWGQPSSFTTT